MVFLPRKIFKALLQQGKERRISLLLGARQVGKTTLLKALFEEFSEKNKCLFLDLDILSNYESVSTFERLVNTLKANGYSEEQKGFFYLFLDEFHRYSSLVFVLKNAFDNLENLKVFASGSSSLEIKKQVGESLAGRKTINEIYPLDFEEFLWFKQNKQLVEKRKNSVKLRGTDLLAPTKDLRNALEEFLVFGGYPEVALKKTPKEKRMVLESIFDLYAKKDLASYIGIGKLLKAKKLIEFLAVNHGQKIKFENAASACTLTYAEIKAFVELLSETYIVYELRPFYTNKNKELVKIPKIYFTDNGVRNFFVNNFNDLGIRNDAGFLFEAFVLSEFVKNDKKNIKFWQDKNNNEVDFVPEQKKLIAIEAKFKPKLKNEDFVGINAFKKNYARARTCIVNLGVQDTRGKTKKVLPYCLLDCSW